MYRRFFKRIFDILFVLLTSPIWLSIFSITFLILFFINHKPIFYLGKRVGQFNKEFRILKFRSLNGGGTEKTGDTVSHDDNRLSKIGFFLRKFKIDEIPQFLQVLIGQMSIVGPRPELPVYVDKEFYEKNKINLLKPGLTDYSSIEFIDLQKIVPKNNTNDFVEKKILKKKNLLKAKYARNISFWIDLTIILKTVLKLCTKK